MRPDAQDQSEAAPTIAEAAGARAARRRGIASMPWLSLGARGWSWCDGMTRYSTPGHQLVGVGAHRALVAGERGRQRVEDE